MPPRERRHFRGLHSSESGFAMIMALVLVLIMWLLTVALANLAVSEYATAAGVERSSQAFLAAEAGIERGIADLNADSDWEDGVGVEAGVTTAWTLRYQDIPLSNGAKFSVWLRDPYAGPNLPPNSPSRLEIRAIGEARGAARTIEYAVENDTALDIVLYSINDLNTCAIPGGGSLQFHGSAYIEQDMCLKGGSQAGFYNDRYVLSSDAPNYFNHTTADLHVYVPGGLFLSSRPSIGNAWEGNIRYEGKGTIVVANQPQATVYSSLQPQSGCAFDFNRVAGDNMPCDGNPNDGRWIKSKVSPCLGSPGTDNPGSTYVSSDLAIFIVNGSAYSQLNSNSCAQEMDMVAIVGDRNASGTGPCITEGITGACFRILKKLQWYGVLMTKQFGLGQVPNFWQMPDLRLKLPSSVQNLFQPSLRIIEVKKWQEIF